MKHHASNESLDTDYFTKIKTNHTCSCKGERILYNMEAFSLSTSTKINFNFITRWLNKGLEQL